MSFIKMPSDAFDCFTVLARPSKTFTSSSDGTSTGKVRVFKTFSPIEKDSAVFNDEKFDENSPESLLFDAKKFSTQNDFSSYIEAYMKSVNDSPEDPRFSKEVEVIRFEPSFKFTSDTLRKSVIRTTQLPHYRISYPGIGWGYTNYCSIHFPNDIGPSSASIIYPNPIVGSTPVYSPRNEFTTEFYVKPSYTGLEYRAGTVMHMSSCLAISIVSGTSTDHRGYIDSFRVLLQLSHSADINPSDVNFSSLGSGNLDLAYISDDGFIKLNNWHHISIAWSPSHNDSSGTFYVDGKNAGNFHCPDSLLPFSSSCNGRSVISIGNFYDGKNEATNGPHGFFDLDAITDEGVTNAFNASIGDPQHPNNYSFLNPFRGEVNEIRIWNKRRDIESIITGSKLGASLESDLLFYVPPFFRSETSERKVLQTPFQSYYDTTNDPFNVALSFGVGGHHINIENHLREFVKGYYPRLLFLTSSEITYQVQSYKEANEYLYATGSTVRRNLTILPCDNGKFYPNFSLLYSSSDNEYLQCGVMEKFINDAGAPNLSFVNLSNIVLTSSLFNGLVQDGELLKQLAGASPEDPGIAPGAVLTIFQRTRDESSNAVTIFDASNLYYGSRIHPETYQITDHSFTGSEGTLKITLRDNGYGSLYRADADSQHAKWASSGFVLYPEGISVVTSPYLGEMFGKDSFEASFQGMQPVHVLEMQAIVPAWSMNTSSNPQWKSIYLSDYANDTQPGFVRISRINFHDENLNVIARSEIAQPINKRTSDRIMFRTKIDF